MSRFNYLYSLVTVLFGLSTTLPNFALGQETPGSNTSPWLNAKQTIGTIANDGKWDIYLAGHAHHFRRSDADFLNEKAWGVGVGKTLRNAAGNDESLYVLVNRDSNRDIEYIAGYTHQWIYKMPGGNLDLGAGLTAFIISRQDCFKGIPFPGILPVASIGTRSARIMATITPYHTIYGKYSTVALVLGKLQF